MNRFFGRNTVTGSNTQRAFSRLMMTSALVAAGTLVLSSSAMADPWSDVKGPGFTNTSGGSGITNITATTANGKASGAGNLDILAGETVNIDAKLFVARDNRANIKTSILGELNSNGAVILIDRNGIIFGKDSRVDVGSLIATTGDVSDSLALANGNAPLLFSNFGTGEIVNNGNITAGDFGLVAFVGPVVKNNGVINANLGNVSLTAGNQTATVDLYGDQLVELAVSPVSDVNSKFLAENTGEINAVGGKIQMTAQAAKSVVDSVVNMQGVLRASSATVTSSGSIILTAGTVKVGAAPQSVGVARGVKPAEVTGNTTINSTVADLGIAIDGKVTGKAKEVNILSDAAKIGQGLDIVTAKGKINVAAGTYNEHLVVNKEGVTINGANAGVSANGVRGDETIINPNSPGIEITANNVTIDGLTFADALNLDGYGIFVNGGNNANLKNNIIRNTAQSGIYVLGASGVTITNNNIGGTAGAGNIGADGIHLLNTSGAIITGNNISNTTSPADEVGSGVYVENSTNATVSGNTINDVKWDGVKVKGGSGSTVSGNTISNTARAAVAVSYAANTVVSNNIGNNMGMWGIWSTNNNGLTLSGNTLKTTKSYGIFSDRDANLVINGNTVDKTNRNGVQVQNTAGTVEIKGNKIGLLGGANNINGDGINLYNANGAVVSGNTITGTTSTGDEVGSGIYSQQSNDVTISGNTIYKAAWDGIKIKGGDNYLVSTNTIHNVVRSTVAASETTKSTISGTIGGNTGMWGIWSSLNDNIKIIGNTIGTTNRSGILSYLDTGITIDNNTVTDTKRDGINVQSSSGVKVTGNFVGTAGAANNIIGNGVYLFDTDGAIVSGNTIANTKSPSDEVGSGVFVQQSDDVQITGNTIYNVAWDGVKVNEGDNYLISGNIISNTGRSAVAASYITGSTISGTIGNNMGMWGIWSINNEGLTLSGNNLKTVNSYGIFSDRDTDTLISGNTINATGNDGIHVQNTSGTIKIDGNFVGTTGAAKNIKGDGINLYNTDGAVVIGNFISNTSTTGDEIGSGVYAQQSNDVEISGNIISKTGWDAVKVKGGDNYLVSENIGTTIGRSMVAVSETTNSTVSGNNGTKMSQWGLWSTLNDNLLITGNILTNSARTGILSYLDNDIEISGNNKVTGAKRDGIRVLSGSGVVYVSGNTVTDSGDNGIYIGLYTPTESGGEESARVDVADGIYVNNNTITNTGLSGLISPTGLNGVFIENSESPVIEVNNNTIKNSTNGNGIEFANVNGGITINGNDIQGSSRNGIYASNVNRNLDTFAGEFSGYKLTIGQPNDETTNKNDIDASGDNGIELNEVGGVVTIGSNEITNSSANGILVSNTSFSGGEGEGDFGLLAFANPIELHIVDNTVLNTIGTEGGEGEGTEGTSGFAAVNLSLGADGYTELSGNTLGDNFEYGLVAYTGTIDLTGASNTIRNTDIGMGFYPGAEPESDTPEYFDYLASLLQLVGNTIGTTNFIDQSEAFVDLGYGAFYAPGSPTFLDGNNSTYTLGGVTIDPASNGGFVTDDELVTLETYFNHYNDAQNRGLFFFATPTVPAPTVGIFDQKDVLRFFNAAAPQSRSGSLTITGLPSVASGTAGAGTTGVGTGAFNPNAIEPAAGDEGTSTQPTNVADIQPAAGANDTPTACWSDATASLGQGSAVTFNFGADQSALLQNAVTCGSGGQGAAGAQAL